ncbi:MAG: hypothetical protein ACREIC_12865 [Limisphaerales bacterium]
MKVLLVRRSGHWDVAARQLPGNALQNTEVDEDLEHELAFLGLIGMIDPP